MNRARVVLVLSIFLLPTLLIAQGPPPPLPPEVGNAVLLATHGIQVDRDVVVHTGDLVVNGAEGNGLHLDQGVRTPPGYAVKASSVVIDARAIVNGAVHYNVLQNGGTVNGALVTPLAMPVIGTLPQLPNRPVGSEDVVVPDGGFRILGRGDFAALVIGENATVRFPGGPYTFTSITMARGATIFWDGPGDVIVYGQMTLGADTTIAPAPNVTTKRRMFFVHAAVSIGSNADISATIHAPNGTVDAGRGLEFLGSIVARDIHIGRDASLMLRSGFRNLPPIAIGQTVQVPGMEAKTITLSGFDPDSDPLTFSIVIPPQLGRVSAITRLSPTTASVVYTPVETESPNDIFMFQVADSEAFTANGLVRINAGAPLPPPPTTITAQHANIAIPAGPPSILSLNAIGPPGVAITISIVPNSGPSHGTFGPLQQPSTNPQRPAQIVFVPEPGYVGGDEFYFRACGVINGEEVCSDARVAILIEGPEPPTELAPDFASTITAGQSTTIALGNDAGPPPTPGPTFNAPLAIAGSVADANGDGEGDNHQPLPGTAPTLMAAGTGQSGGAGANGTVRIHFEWDISDFAELAQQLQSATVVLRTHRTASDTLPTNFYIIGTSGDGQLSDGDFAHEAELMNIIMPVPENQPVGADGLFSFDMAEHVRDALRLGFSHIVIQGRVSERGGEGPANGLHVYTSASVNFHTLPPRAPQLALTQTGTSPRAFRITSLPASGSLADGNGNTITAVPYTLPNMLVTYRSLAAFSGVVTFTYEVAEGTQSDTGTVTITVQPGGGDGRD